eukprot:2680307-Pyramimonas_sp.AAC.1
MSVFHYSAAGTHSAIILQFRARGPIPPPAMSLQGRHPSWVWPRAWASSNSSLSGWSRDSRNRARIRLHLAVILRS